MTIKEVSEKYGISADTLRYYERVGVIPAVNRNKSGIRDYNRDDLNWVENAICMRQAGLSVEFLVEYLGLYQQGNTTFKARLDLLSEQRELLLLQFKQLQETIEKLNYKISRYENAVQTGILSWDDKGEKEC